ncbi:MAG: CAP domain-containing protein [Chloroflexota bacterium]
MKHKLYLCILVMLSFGFTNIIYAQTPQSPRIPVTIFPQTNTECDDIEERYIWEDTNGYRTSAGFKPVAFSERLCQIAQEHLNDLLTRTVTISNEERSDGTFLPTWLDQAGYLQYPEFDEDEFVGKVFVWNSPELTLERRNNLPSLVEHHWLLGNQNGYYGMMINPNYREIGIAYQTETLPNNIVNHYAVIIMVANPGDFPVIPVELNGDALARPRNQRADYPGIIYAYDTESPTIGLMFHQENIDGYERGVLTVDANDNPLTTMGATRYFRYASSENDEITCPNGMGEIASEWIDFPADFHRHTFSGSRNLITLHFQLCDGAQRSAMTSVTINYRGALQITRLPQPVHQHKQQQRRLKL